jgi:transcription elongation factor GreA
VGTKVLLVNEDSSDNAAFTILGPWDADFDKKILSYRSPIAKSLLGKKTGEQVKLRIDDDEERVFVVNSIDKYSL